MSGLREIEKMALRGEYSEASKYVSSNFGIHAAARRGDDASDAQPLRLVSMRRVRASPRAPPV